jgi:hypothetical protein
MPLTFESLSHGTVAFGFFNIESDMLLLESYFFFAPDFCGLVEKFAGAPELREAAWTVSVISEREAIGDLMGAIHGVRFTGFIGEVYRRFPFPGLPEGFRQNPEGFRTRPVMEAIIARYGRPAEIEVAVSAAGREVGIGDYRFGREAFHELLGYVWRGGYPRWRDGVRPEEVRRMAAAVRASRAALFAGAGRHVCG